MLVPGFGSMITKKEHMMLEDEFLQKTRPASNAYMWAAAHRGIRVGSKVCLCVYHIDMNMTT